MTDHKIARWESRGGKYWVELYFNPAFLLNDGRTIVDAHYKGDGCGGSISAQTPDEAIAVMQRWVDGGRFQADANKTPMKRVL